MEERQLSLSEVAQLLDKSERTIRRWIKSGKLRAYKPGRDYLIPESGIREFIEASEVRPKVLAPPDLQPSFNDVLEEERRLLGYLSGYRALAKHLADRAQALMDAADGGEEMSPTDANSLAEALYPLDDALADDVRLHELAQDDGLPDREFELVHDTYRELHAAFAALEEVWKALEAKDEEAREDLEAKEHRSSRVVTHLEDYRRRKERGSAGIQRTSGGGASGVTA